MLPTRYFEVMPVTESLRRVIAQIEQLPESEQNAYAAAIQAELEEDRRWEAAMDDPHDLVIDRLITEAKAQVARGEARDLDESL